MGGCGSAGGRDETSKRIDQKLRQSQDNSIKLLLLGAGECGKSTIFKQLKLIQDKGGFNEEEKRAFKFHLYCNLISQMRTIIEVLYLLNHPLEKEESNQYAKIILELSRDSPWTKELGDMIKFLWSDTGIQFVFEKRGSLYQLNDTIKYFFDNIDTFNNEDYLPTDHDILRIRIRTTGVEESDFIFSGRTFKVIDVGGQRSERRKWIHCFDGVTSVIFCASLADYDLTMREDGKQNRLQESIMLFADVCQQEAFLDKPMILFLNKIDILEEKLTQVPLQKWQPEFEATNSEDAAQTFQDAKKFLRSLFLRRTERRVYTHFTCALDTNNMSLVIQDVRNALLKTMLAESGLHQI